MEDYELALESAILTAQSNLNGARKSFTDAELDTALAAAQKIIDEDTGRYNDSGAALFLDSNDALVRIYASTDDLTTAAFTWSTTANAANSKFVGYALTDPSAVTPKDQSTVASISPLADGAYTAKQVQNFVTSTLSAYEAHVTQKGETADLVADLKDAVALYLAQNADVPALSGALTAAITNYENSIKTTTDEGRTENIAFYDAVKAAYDAIYTGGDNGDESTLEDNDRGASLEALLETLEKRNELSDAYGDTTEGAVAVFTAVDGGLSADYTAAGLTDYATAESDVALRDAQIEAVATAQADADEFAALIEAYNTASDSVTAADEALGYSIEDIDEAVEFGTTEDDLFILDLESLDTSNITEVSILDAAAGDIVFFGSDYVLGSDIAAGDNNALEVFITADGDNTVVMVETEAFGSNTSDNIEVTLLGIASDSVSFEGGVLTIA